MLFHVIYIRKLNFFFQDSFFEILIIFNHFKEIYKLDRSIHMYAQVRDENFIYIEPNSFSPLLKFIWLPSNETNREIGIIPLAYPHQTL